MKFYVGKPAGWFGPYQLADLLQYVGVSEDTCYALGAKLSKTWLNTVCEWLHKHVFYQRKVIKIHYYDTWSVDHTLSMIILPLLKQLRDTQHGSPFTDDEDAPEHLRSTAVNALTEEQRALGMPDSNHEARWKWILDEMVWAFEQLNDEDHDKKFWKNPELLDDLTDPDKWEASFKKMEFDREGLKAHEERIRRGTTLFGKYYQALWD